MSNCLKCQNCKTVRRRDKVTAYCKLSIPKRGQSSQGRAITYNSDTYKQIEELKSLTLSMATVELLERGEDRLAKYLETHKTPKWCPLQKE